MSTVPERLAALRKVMEEKGIDTYVIYTADAHQSEYTASYWKARAYISGFTGSAGSVVVTRTEAACWVDGRYFLQGARQLEGSGIDLMKMGEPGVPELNTYVLEKTPEGGKAGLDGRTIGSAQARQLQHLLSSKQITLVSRDDLIGMIWSDRPSLPMDPIWDFPVEFAGESRESKLSRLRAYMDGIGADYYLEPSLDANAWLLNYRCVDIEYVPVAYAYTLTSRTDCQLFIEKAKVSEAMEEKLAAAGVYVRPYASLPQVLSSLSGCIAFDPTHVSELLMESLSEKAKPLLESVDEIALMKAVKNETEQQNVRAAHVKDGAVMVRLLKWVKENAAKGITEMDICDFLEKDRCSQKNSLGLSFGTIAGYGPNGAIVHYAPQRGQCATLKPEGFVLVDSGAQYMEGTTDITRTIACGPLTDEMKRAYTLVLKGHLQLGHAHFKAGATGTSVDILARKPLWDEGLDYKHGTGHGVGYVLSVHEGPQNISNRMNAVALTPGMIVSDEPGFYPTGKFGVRIENLVMVQPYTQNEWGTFYQMEPLTLCPYERDAIVKEMLTEEETRWVDAYHQHVYETLAPLLDEDTRAFLKEVTRPL